MEKSFKRPRFIKFKCGLWFNTETLQTFEIRPYFQNYDVVELDVFGNEFSGEVEIVSLLEKMSKLPFEYLGEV
jgi:hypothetical protein